MRLARLAEDSPWAMRDILRLAWAAGLGLVGLAVCWYGISGGRTLGQQIGWLVGAIGALAFAGLGMVGFLLAGIREVHAEMYALVSRIRTERLGENLDEVDDLEAETATPQQDSADHVDGYVMGTSMTRVHRADCPHVRGKVVEPISAADVTRLGLATCGVCC